MTEARDVLSALRDCAARLDTASSELSPLLRGSYGFTVRGRDEGWVLRVTEREVRVIIGRGVAADTWVHASSWPILHTVVVDPSQMVRFHQEGDVELDDDTLAPVIARLLEAPWQSEARELRVLSRMGSWGRLV